MGAIFKPLNEETNGQTADFEQLRLRTDEVRSYNMSPSLPPSFLPAFLSPSHLQTEQKTEIIRTPGAPGPSAAQGSPIFVE